MPNKSTKLILSTVVFIISIFSIFITSVIADTIYLKNGQNMKGIIKDEDEDNIKLDIGSGIIGIRKEYIKQIDKINPEESKVMLKEFERNRQEPRWKSEEVNYGSGRTLEIRINPMMEFDFKTKREIYDIRKRYVLEYPELLKKIYVVQQNAPESKEDERPGWHGFAVREREYKPDEAVFGGIEDGKPWIGILGLSYYGYGEKSNEGLSEESRFIANPYLLIGLGDRYLFPVTNIHLPPVPIYPQPQKLCWDSNGFFALVTYDLSSYLRLIKTYYNDQKEAHSFGLSYYNARDFGFRYMYIDSSKSENAVLHVQDNIPVELIQYLHKGGNIHPEGVNNMSPEQKEAYIDIWQLPMRLYIKLWREKPSSVNLPADMVFVIESK